MLKLKCSMVISTLFMLMHILFFSENNFGQQQTREGYTSIFNGINLDGWTVTGSQIWYLDNGELVSEIEPGRTYGYLSTKKNYRDFTLLLQFKQEHDGNGGVYFRSKNDNGKKITGWQAKIEDPGNHTGGVFESNGRGWLMQPKPEDEKFIKAGEWNDFHIRVIKDEVWTWINGHELVHFKDEKIGETEGFIALEINNMHRSGSNKIRWRNILIREEK